MKVADEHGNTRDRLPSEPIPVLDFGSFTCGLGDRIQGHGRRLQGACKERRSSCINALLRARAACAEEILPSENHPMDVNIFPGAPVKLSVSSSPALVDSIPSRVLLTTEEHCISIVAEDEAGNKISDPSAISSVFATSDDLAARVYATRADNSSEFKLPDLGVIRSERSNQLELKIEAEISRARAQQQSNFLPQFLRIGNGYAKSAYVVRLQVSPDEPARHSFVAGQPMPDVAFQLCAEDASDDFSTVEAAAITVQSTPPQPSSITLTSSGFGRISFVEPDGSRCAFKSIGLMRVILKYSEERKEWSWLPRAHRSPPPLVVEFNVSADSSKPSPALLKTPPEPFTSPTRLCILVPASCTSGRRCWTSWPGLKAADLSTSAAHHRSLWQ